VPGRDQSLADGMAMGQRCRGVGVGVGVWVWAPALVDDCRPGPPLVQVPEHTAY